MPEYVSPLRSLLSNNFFFLLLPTTVSFKLITFRLLTDSWQFVISLPTKGLLYTSFHTMVALLHKADGDITQRIQDLPWAIHANRLCCQGQVLPLTKLFWLVTCKPRPCSGPSPDLGNSKIIRKNH